MRKLLWGGTALVLLILLAAWWIAAPTDRQSGEAPPPATPVANDVVARGRELVLLAGCESCHTARGGAPFAGGRPIPTRFGVFFAPNITPDAATGLGAWSATDFWHALHNGYSKNGAALYPTFPYTNYTRISRRDADTMYAYLRTVAPVRRVNRPHQLAFPYNHRTLLTVWRWLFFRPGVYLSDPAHDPQWNRGAYLVQGLSHCSACHEARNALGATRAEAGPTGGLVLDWYAPSLMSPREAGVQHWTGADVLALLKTGVVDTRTAKATTVGPMAEVVVASLQRAPDDELQAIATYLRSLPVVESPTAAATRGAADVLLPAERVAGEELYKKNCADCHGDHGEGRDPAAPPLAGNRAVTMPSAVNPIRLVLFGGYAPGTAGNPRPFGMPPYSLTLSDEQIAEVLNYVRTSWGNAAPPVQGEEISANRGNPLW